MLKLRRTLRRIRKLIRLKRRDRLRRKTNRLLHRKDENIPHEFRGTKQRREHSQRKSTLDKETEILISAMAAALEDAYVPPPEDAEEAELLAKLRGCMGRQSSRYFNWRTTEVTAIQGN
jgi:hypothetical protein